MTILRYRQDWYRQDFIRLLLLIFEEFIFVLILAQFDLRVIQFLLSRWTFVTCYLLQALTVILNHWKLWGAVAVQMHAWRVRTWFKIRWLLNWRAYAWIKAGIAFTRDNHFFFFTWRAKRCSHQIFALLRYILSLYLFKTFLGLKPVLDCITELIALCLLKLLLEQLSHRYLLVDKLSISSALNPKSAL